MSAPTEEYSSGYYYLLMKLFHKPCISTKLEAWKSSGIRMQLISWMYLRKEISLMNVRVLMHIK